MSFNFTVREFLLGNGTGTPTLQFYKRGFELSSGGESPSWRDIILSGNTALTLTNALANSINYLKLFGGTEQRNIPSEFTQVNYVTNTGQTLLDTGIKFDFSKNYEIELRVRGVTGSWYILQAKETSGNEIWGLSGSQNGQTIRLGFDANSATSRITRVDGNIYYLKGTVNNGNLTLYVKDETAGTEDTATGTYTVTTGQSSNISLFGNLVPQYVAINSNVYFARIKENGNYIMNYVPCKQNTTAGFYDKATNTFKTTTNLSAGADVVPSPDTPMDIVSNNGVVKVRNKSGLPLGYTLLDYIESTGTQYIDTGIIPDNDTGFSVTLQCVNIPTDNFVYGARQGDDGRFVVGAKSDSVYVGYGSQVTLYNWQGVASPSVRNNIKVNYKNSRIAQLNNELDYNLPSTLPTFDNATTVTLFGRNANGTVVGFAQRVYDNKITQGNNVIRNYIPCRRNSDSALGMYDTVTGNFLTNQGTGTFTAGNAVSDPVEIYADGTVETVQVTGKNLFDGQWQGGIYSPTTGVYSPTANRICNTNIIQVKPSTTYTVSCPNYALENGMRWAFYDKNKNFISASTNGATTINTPSNAKYINFYIANNLTVDTAPDLQIEQGSTATTYEPYYNGGSATAEMLLKVGDYKDVQEVLTGGVTRKVGIKVLDGTESFVSNVITNCWALTPFIGTGNFDDKTVYCSHFKNSTFVPPFGSREGYAFIANSGNNYTVAFGGTGSWGTSNVFKQWLTDQYNAGQPVVIVYPLATATTETVTGQPLTTQAGSNTVSIVQSAIDNLGLEVSYKAVV